MSFAEINVDKLRTFVTLEMQTIIAVRACRDDKTISMYLGKTIRRLFRPNEVLDTREKVETYLDSGGTFSTPIQYNWRSNYHWNKMDVLNRLFRLCDACDSGRVFLSSDDAATIEYATRERVNSGDWSEDHF